MMQHHRLLVLAVAATALAACGGSESSASTSGPTSSAAASETTTPDSVAPDTTGPDTTAPATSAPDAGGATAACMEGDWTADAAEHQRRIDQLGIALPMTVGPESTSTLSIADGAFVADAAVTISGSIGAATLTSSSTSHIEGTFTLDGDVVRADVTVLENEPGPFVVTGPDGTAISVPGADAFDPPAVAPDFEGSTVSCDDSSLTFDVIGTNFGSITYTRAG